MNYTSSEIPLRAIVFDLDDTLYPERDYVLSGMQAVASWASVQFRMPKDQVYRDLEQAFIDGIRGNSFDQWLVKNGLEPEQWVPVMVKTYRQHQPALTLGPGVDDLLSRMRSRYQLGLLTDGFLEVQRRKVEALKIADCFDAILYTDEFGRDAWKPNPRVFQLMLDRLRVTSSEAVYVGDNPAKDFRGARSLGMATIRVRCPDGLHCNVEPASADDGPHCEIEELGQLENLLSCTTTWYNSAPSSTC